MGHLAAHEGHVLDAGHMDVGDEHAATVEIARILLTQQAGADPAFGICLVRHALPVCSAGEPVYAVCGGTYSAPVGTNSLV